MIIIIIIETCLSEFLIDQKHFVQAHSYSNILSFLVLCTPNCPSGILTFIIQPDLAMLAIPQRVARILMKLHLLKLHPNLPWSLLLGSPASLPNIRRQTPPTVSHCRGTATICASSFETIPAPSALPHAGRGELTKKDLSWKIMSLVKMQIQRRVQKGSLGPG